MSKLRMVFNEFGEHEFSRTFEHDAVTAEQFMQFCVDSYAAFTYCTPVNIEFPDSADMQDIKFKNNS